MNNNNIRLGFELRKTMNTFNKRIENSYFIYLHPELRGKNIFILNYLAKNEKEDIFQKDIEKEFGLHKSSVSDIISCLEGYGYITRECLIEDSRFKNLHITETGKAICQDFKSELDKIELELQTKLSAEEISDIVMNLIKIQKCLLGD